MHSPPANRDFEIRAATESDAAALAEIYNPYILETTITFEEAAISPSDMATRIAEADGVGLPFLLADARNVPIGFAYASIW